MYRRTKRQLPPPPPVSMREFIKAWQESSSLAEVAQKVRSKKKACRVRAFRYRQEGDPLKEFPVVFAEPTDWDELSRNAASLLPDGESRGKAGCVDFDDEDEPSNGNGDESLRDESNAQSRGNSQ